MIRSLFRVLLVIVGLITWLWLVGIAGAQDAPKRIAVFYGLGSSNPKGPEKNTAGWGVNRYGGYDQFFARAGEVLEDTGISELFIHLPAGRHASRPMNFDAFARLADLRGDLVPELSPRTGQAFSYELGQFLEQRPGVIVHVYFGALAATKSMTELLDRPADYLDRFNASIRPVLDVPTQFEVSADRLRIYFDLFGGGGDHSPLVGPDSPEFHLAQFLRSTGFRVGMEPHPRDQPEFEHLYDFDVTAKSSYWHKSHSKQSVKPKLRGDVVIIYNVPKPADESEIIALLADPYVDVIAISPIFARSYADKLDAIANEGLK